MRPKTKERQAAHYRTRAEELLPGSEFRIARSIGSYIHQLRNYTSKKHAVVIKTWSCPRNETNDQKPQVTKIVLLVGNRLNNRYKNTSTGKNDISLL